MSHLLTKLTNVVRGKNRTEENFLNYSSEKQKKILKRAIEGANRRQMELEQRYLATEAKVRKK